MVLSIKEFILRNAVILGALILLVVFLSGTASADIIYLRTGGFWKGAARRSRGDSLRLNLQGGYFKIDLADIDSIRFDASDSITLLNGERIKGKAYRSVHDSLLITTSEGLRAVAADSVAAVLHNCGGPMTVRMLPETDCQFAPTNVGIIKDHPPGVVFRVNGNVFVPFITSNNAGLAGMAYLEDPSRQHSFGIGIGATLVRGLTYMMQYERYSTGTRTASGGSDEAYYEFVYGSIEFQFGLAAQSNWSYCFAFDLGIQSSREEFYSGSGGGWALSGSSIMARPRFEVEYSVPRSNFALRVGAGYLPSSGNVVDFTGTSLNTSLLFRIPYFGGPL
jgi:hypothetical protein